MTDKGDDPNVPFVIEAAIARDRMLVPVFTPEFDFGDIERFLPADTAAALRGFNMLEIPPKYFKYAIQELAENFDAVIDQLVALHRHRAATIGIA